jgi:gliding motility-associated-like protein
VLANDYDPDDNHDELSIVSFTEPSSGSVSIVDGKIVYQPADLNIEMVTFTYTIQDPAGLTDKAVVTIVNITLPLAISEGFSPNSDNNNETWYIQGIEKYPHNYVKVYDRWGFLVYQKEGYNNVSAWDGRGNTAQQSGKLLDQGTYYYILEPGDELQTLTGYVVIIR